MQSLLSVYEDIEKLGIPVIFDTLDAGCITIRIEDDIRFIILDKHIKSEQEETIKLTHELGHHVTGTLYCEEDSDLEKSKCEYRANKWSVYRLIPYEDMEAAMQAGNTEIWELAEHFSMPEDFIRLCFRYYEDDGLYFPPVCMNE